MNGLEPATTPSQDPPRVHGLLLVLVVALLLPSSGSQAATSAVPVLQTNLVSPWIQLAPPMPLSPGSNTPPALLQPQTNAPTHSLLLLTQPDPAKPPPFSWPTQRLRGSVVPIRDFVTHFGGGELVRLTQGPDPSYELRSGKGRLSLQVSSTRASLLGVQVALSQVPQLQGGELWLNRFDLQNTIHPILWTTQQVAVAHTGCVMLDPGHGGRDVGTTSVDGRSYEKNHTLDWAMRLRALLERQGWRVLLTRTNDTDVSLAQRVYLAEEAKVDLFISLHFNSAPSQTSRRGLETYALTPPGMLSTVVRDSEDNPRLHFPNNRYDLPNFLLAWDIQKATIPATSATDRGVQRARFMGVLRGQNRPAVLVEGGYLSHPEESRRIADPHYRQKLAEGIANALKTWELPSSDPH